MSDYVRPNGITAMNDHSVAGDGIPSAEFDAEFNGLVTEVNKMWQKDGAEPMTGPLKLRKGADVLAQPALFTVAGFPTDGNYFDITGADTITSILTSGNSGTVIMLHFDGICTLTHHATDLVLPSGQDIVTAAGDEFTFVEYASGDWRLMTRNIAPAALPPVGVVNEYAGFTAPNGWLLCSGAAVARASYSALNSLLNPSLGAVTVTIASPGVFDCSSHGLQEGDAVFITTDGAVPTGLTASTTRYFVIAAGLTASSFQVSATFGGAAVNTSGTQSGVHTLYRSPFGVGDGSTTFNVPDLRGRFALGRDNMGGTSAGRVTAVNADALGGYAGSDTHALAKSEIPTHVHTQINGGSIHNATDTTVNFGAATGGTVDTGNGSADGLAGAAHNNMSPYIAMNYIIKY